VQTAIIGHCETVGHSDSAGLDSPHANLPPVWERRAVLQHGAGRILTPNAALRLYYPWLTL